MSIKDSEELTADQRQVVNVRIGQIKVCSDPLSFQEGLDPYFEETAIKEYPFLRQVRVMYTLQKYYNNKCSLEDLYQAFLRSAECSVEGKHILGIAIELTLFASMGVKFEDAVEYCIGLNTISRTTKEFKEGLKNFLTKK